MSWSLVVTKGSVKGDDPERVRKVAGLLALALRNAADAVQAENYDVEICLDGNVATEAEVRDTVLRAKEAA